MTGIELDGVDGPACPSLGMAADRRSRHTYPHPDHRCFATKHPTTTEVRRQVTFCLSSGFTTCDRYLARNRLAEASAKRRARQAPRERSVATGSTSAGASAGRGTVIHVFRAGDSLARIATAYGLTVDQIAKANGLTFNAVLVDGTRLVIPLARSDNAERQGP